MGFGGILSSLRDRGVPWWEGDGKTRGSCVWKLYLLLSYICYDSNQLE